MRKNAFIVGAIALLCLFTYTYLDATGAFVKQIYVPASANIKSVKIGVYWNAICTNKTSSINWNAVNSGLYLEPGNSYPVTLYLKNEANVQVTFTKYESNWYFNGVANATSSYITLTWNWNVATLVPKDQVNAVVFTLTIDSRISDITTFAFDINLVSSG